MKKVSTKADRKDGDGMRAEYDFSGGVRGKHYRAMQAGYTVTIRKADGTAVVKEVRPKEGAVILEPDVREYFSDSESVNATLRSLIRLIPEKRPSGTKTTQGAVVRRRVPSGSRSKSTSKRP
ncbi:hypothetical protein MELA_00506 [Candidatus Methylomirabilis lanthanidiphila]|uniref:Uncharacterized protein n=1 Tax=Candidatus Methylomirabilis lanthanidiphila TaxID=2211376 RepID=A0A564ZFP6_9BACT|nr:hypothetical protein [Candidatus Methylomirabilis lanthanidiphila]VUZ84140.1 hypothetical protein MELA_00506 [Candidatus Methylomirabilis lanthanidiphila]